MAKFHYTPDQLNRISSLPYNLRSIERRMIKKDWLYARKCYAKKRDLISLLKEINYNIISNNNNYLAKIKKEAIWVSSETGKLFLSYKKKKLKTMKNILTFSMKKNKKTT